MSVDRRRWRRLTSELRLQLHIPEGDGVRVVAAIGSHLNPEGIFVQLADPPALGTRLKVTLAAEATEGLLTAEGEVVDRVVDDPADPRPSGVGLRLDQAGAAWARLYEWLGGGA